MTGMGGGRKLPELWDALAARVPKFVQRALVLGAHAEALGELLRRQGMTDVYVAEHPSRQWPFPQGWIDALLVERSEDLAACGDLLASTGLGLVFHHGPLPDDETAVLTQAGLFIYGFLAASPAGEVAWRNAGEAQAEDAGADTLVMVVRQDYNPLAHARALMNRRRPQWAIEVLLMIPQVYLEDPVTEAHVAAEFMLCLLMTEGGGVEGRLNRFVEATRLFYMSAHKNPLCLPLYECHAEFWRCMGNADMARAMLRSVLHVSPDEDVTRHLQSITEPRAAAPDMTPPPWRPDAAPRRILLVTHPRPHYGLDVLYDGLCQVLGDDNVVEYPYKPLLHGEAPPGTTPYPCTFAHPGRALTLDEILARLQAGAFDAVVWGDVERTMDRSAAQRISNAAACPVFLLDQQDEPDLLLRDTLAWLGRQEVAGLFKREMITTVDYGPRVMPMPFAYSDSRVPEAVAMERTQPIFWAGHRETWLRRLYLDRIEEVYGLNLGVKYDPEAYKDAMLRSLIGINVFGLGFDTVRYWELPAHGCLLLSERLPIRIPFDFVDGESAVFFSDLPELEEKLGYYLHHKEETTRIAQAGRQHLLAHHTSSQRAKHLLAWMQTRTGI